MNKNPFPLAVTTNPIVQIEDDSVLSNNFNDIYFQPNNGLEEKKYVFLDGNNLPQNWKKKSVFTIAETGFGIGLNFLSTLKLWHETHEKNQQLHYISCELFPFDIQQLDDILSPIETLKPFTKIFLEKYPQVKTYGFHRIRFEEFNCTLMLIFGDCVDAFENMDAKIDAWFLDGFAPSKNPQMWSERLFKRISELSQQGTTLSTYSVAANLKKQLTENGFVIQKKKGFGKKREMLTATFQAEQTEIFEKQPWAQTFSVNEKDEITILGAGIAGLSIADCFYSYGKKVTMIDRQVKPCLETSGNPQAMVMPSFDLNDSPEARFYLTAFLYAVRYYSNQFYHPVGVHHLAFTEKQQCWQDKLLNKFNLPELLIKYHDKGILYPSAGWLDTQGHAEDKFKKIDNYISAEIDKILFEDGLWHLFSNGKLIHKCKTLILANGINVVQLLANSNIDYQLPLTAKHGQISYFKTKNSDSIIAKSPHVQLADGYITPQWNGVQTCGATFDHLPENQWFQPALPEEDHWRRNIEFWKDTDYYPELLEFQSHQTRAGIRVTTPDHLPVCGAVIDQKQFCKDYYDIHHGRHWKQYPKPKPINNLYILTGLGSRGFCSAPLLAEYLCNQILGQPLTLDRQMQKTVHPNRFLYRKLQKNNK